MFLLNVPRYLYIGKAEDGRYWFVWGDGLYFTYVTYVGGKRVQKTELFVKLSRLTREVFEKLPRKVRSFLESIGYGVKKFCNVVSTEVKKLINYAITCTKVLHSIIKTLARGTPDDEIAWKVIRRSGELVELMKEIHPKGDEWVKKFELEKLKQFKLISFITQVDYLTPVEAKKYIKKLGNAYHDPYIWVVEKRLDEIIQQL